MLLTTLKLKSIKEISIKKFILSSLVFACMNTSVEALENDGSKPNDLTPPKEASQEAPKNEAPKNEVQRNEAQKETPQSSQTPKEMKVKSISYVGLSYMSDMLANEIVKIRVGDIVDSKKIDTAVLALFNQGYFKDVYATFESGILEFHFDEKARIAGVEIKGYGTEKEKDGLKSQMGIKKGDTFDEQKLEHAKTALKTALEGQGYYGSVVEVRTQKVSEGALLIVFDVNRGDSIYIKQSIYEGSAKLKRRMIESLSANKQRDFMGWMWGLNDGKLRLDQLEYDSLRIQDVYMRRGYLDAHISSPFLKTDFSTHDAKLHYKVKEGIQYRISDILIEIDNPVVPLKTLEKALKVKRKDVFNIEHLRADAQILKTEIADKGYAFAVVKPDLDKDEKNGLVKVIYRIEVGDMVYINDVIISGNQRTSDRIIRRELLLGPKDKYNLTKLRNSENSLRRLGFFSKVKIEEKRVNSSLMDLLVSVEEGRTGQLQFGLGYGSYGGLMLNGSVSERNLFGTGQSMSLYANIATGGGRSYPGMPRGAGRMFAGNLSLTNPRIFDSWYSSTINLYADYRISYQYIQQGGGFGVNVGRMLGNRTHVSLGYNLNVTKLLGFSSPLYNRYYSSTKQIIIPSQPVCVSSLGLLLGLRQVQSCSTPGSTRVGQTPPVTGLWDRDYHTPITSSFTLDVSYDNTDDYYFPRNGVIFSSYATMSGLPSSGTLNSWNGLGGNVRNTKVYGKFAAYHHLQKYLLIDLIARFKTQGGYIFRYNTEDYLSLNSTFYMGGVTTVRGFRNGSITPKDEFGLWLGGDGIFTASTELSYGVLKAAKMRLAWFFDFGFLTFKTPTRGSFFYNAPTTTANFKDYGVIGAGFERATWRASTGLQIEWISPMGPLVLIFPIAFFNQWGDGNGKKCKGLCFNPNMDDYTQHFEFSMGTRF
ncbi:outer membrane protein assembly factor BamA [Helicobacter pylori]|uniref:outer membrane protein assembly factor BamA n=1 Tax=Helicobacter pylori TaxID=210 RepID=UPI0019343A52|nr:outer membrane protein assembly factor BamA [Helicobacter pylori]MBM0602286.1 outer membrane protein assembly factor BamA [Helicobacter pylori]MBM0609922.1 outer membrane protein assembly factor BamA [Helicobacter pylori]MBM0619037.1 outer membrane protein assembly factor BamA [Helicobacter pylori]MBM0626288.1 outer membrane protein assembly factor BamA [Helicobacter pylori]